MPIGVKRTQQFTTGFIAKFVELHLWMPNFDGIAFGLPTQLGKSGITFHNLKSKDLLTEAEHTLNHVVDREVGTHLLLIKIVSIFAQLLSPIGDIPRLKNPVPRRILFLAKCLQFFNLSLEKRLCPSSKIFQETESCRPVLGHALLQHLVGEIGFTQDLGLLLPQLENFCDQLGIVEVATPTHCNTPLPDLSSQVDIIGIFENRKIDRSLQSDAVDRLIFTSEVLSRRFRLEH